MQLYPTLPRRRRATLAGDAAVLALVVLFAWLGLRVHDSLADLAALGRGLQQAGTATSRTAHDAAGAVREGFDAAADAVDAAPLVGGDVAGALRSAGDAAAAPVEREGDAQARKLIAAGRDGERKALATAMLMGWLTFLLPTALVLTRRLPARVRQVQALTAAARVLGTGPRDPERERELARRAVYALPFTALAPHTRDPLGDLLAGRYAPLVAALGEDAGLRLDAGARRR
jgi:hypothetical protein